MKLPRDLCSIRNIVRWLKFAFEKKDTPSVPSKVIKVFLLSTRFKKVMLVNCGERVR